MHMARRIEAGTQLIGAAGRVPLSVIARPREMAIIYGLPRIEPVRVLN